MGIRHSCAYRVSYRDTDCMGRVYYANYLEICERARTELLRAVGFPYRKIEDEGCFFPVRSCQVRYHGYAVYDDELICLTHLSKLSHATLTFVTEITRLDAAKPLVSAIVELACVGRESKPRIIPVELRDAVTPYLEK
ncbi:MAG: acyl-CoA thioesterase [Planctomycetes bacterium]|nr:acyl-CoA thioesterase [Planctomycetota bacterium]